MTTQTKHRSTYQTWLLLGIFILLLMAAESYLIHNIYARHHPGTADFFTRWYGAKELVLTGRDPYSREIELEIQEIMFGRQARPDEDQVNFAYPLYTIFLFWPLIFIPYSWAQAIWMVILQFALIANALLLFSLVRWRTSINLFIITVLWAIFFYPGARAIMLGQFSILVALCLFISLWALLRGRDRLAGLVLPLATIKPQLVFLVIPFMLLWAWRQKRWAFIVAFATSTAVLLAASLLWVPDWPLHFLNNLFAYADYVGHGSPLENMTARFLPAIDQWLNPLLTVALLALLGWQWWLALTSRPESFLWVLTLTLIVSNLIAFRSATTNHVTLYLALFIIFKRLAPAGWRVITVQVLATVGLWVLFLTTIDRSRGDNYEAIFMHGFLPTLLLLTFLLDWARLKAATPKFRLPHD